VKPVLSSQLPDIQRTTPQKEHEGTLMVSLSSNNITTGKTNYIKITLIIAITFTGILRENVKKLIKHITMHSDPSYRCN
jgi:hypothetical protein